MGTMEVGKLPQVNVRNPITIGDHKILFFLYITTYAPDALTFL